MFFISSIGISEFFRGDFNIIKKKFFLSFQRYGTLSFTLSNLVESVLSNLKTKYQLNRVEEFFRKASSLDKLGITATSFQQGLETIKTNMRWIETNKETVSTWLSLN